MTQEWHVLMVCTDGLFLVGQHDSNQDQAWSMMEAARARLRQRDEREVTASTRQGAIRNRGNLEVEGVYTTMMLLGVNRYTGWQLAEKGGEPEWKAKGIHARGSPPTAREVLNTYAQRWLERSDNGEGTQSMVITQPQVAEDMVAAEGRSATGWISWRARRRARPKRDHGGGRRAHMAPHWGGPERSRAWKRTRAIHTPRAR